QFNETQRSIIREAGTLTAEALGQMRRLDQQSFAATQSKRFEYLRNQFGMSSTPDDLVMHFFKGMGRKLNIENSKGNETINWNLENVVIWLMSKDSKIKELVARPNGGHKLAALKGKQVIGHDQHPLLRSELKNVEIIENEFPRLANFRIKTFSLTDDKTHFIRETYATFGKKWLLTFPILDADGKVRGVTDFLMDDPLLPEQEAALHSALHEISILFCHSLDNCRYKQVESFSQKVTGIISEKLIRNETWDVFIPRLEKFKKEKLEDWDFMGMSGVLWTGYQLRPSEESKPMTTQNDQAMIWINQQMKTKSEKKSNLPLYYDIMGFLIKGKYLSKQLTDEIIEKLKLSNIVERKAVLVTLEHAWQLIKEMSFPNNDIDIHDIKNDIEALFLLTDKLMIEELSRKSKAIPSNDESPEINFPLGSELNRNLLRLYLASLLLNASRLRNRYVGLNEDNYPYLVPREVRRQFMVNLSRYILGVIEIIEKDNDVDIEPHLVSRVEFLDSLLYLIDRYAHVELRVEECINIREHLGRGLTAEIEHHLNQTFYRDHLLHVIDVFLIGHLLLNANFTWLNEKDQSFIGHISELMITSQRKTTEDLMRQWAAAALLHDIGYQLDFKRNPEIHRSFFNLSNGTYLNWLNANAESKGKNLKEFAHQLFTGFSNFNNSDEWLPKNNESLNLCDHGIIGSLRLAQVLVHAEAQGIPGGKLNDSRLLEQYSNTLHAISHHNLFNHEVSFMRYPLTCLLRICDELQEWGRRRVNIEQIVKHLYLKIEDIDTKELPSAENLERMETNLDIRSDMEGKLKISLKSEPCNPAFLFRLKYRNPMEVHLDTTTTFLSKAYNLQHVDMEIDTPGSSEPLVFRIELIFPYPVEYFGLTELDIYGLYTENIRSLPLLLVSSNINKAPGGLVQLKSSEKKPSSDRVGIILMGGADSKDRKCWLPCDPASFFDDFFKFKKNILQNRSQDARNQDKS
ncbi:MAG TPA: hypothetical protein VK469_03450, partial [Candidatus Kapabacteria bacterium]|nr:hypothetical protein [Candidatus Kapabacteria bacterium]